jgi:hypothetical protein
MNPKTVICSELHDAWLPKMGIRHSVHDDQDDELNTKPKDKLYPLA